MAPLPSNYIQTTSDWRQSIRRNNRRTIMVIGIFFTVYFMVGILIDLFMQTGEYPQVPLSALLYALLTLKIFPIVTFIMLIVATVSLLITFSLYDKLMLLGTEYHEVTPTNAQDNTERQLYNVIEELKIAAGLHYMPRVFIIEADYMNAFASGYSEKSAMIAITRGLMQKLNRSELQGVMAHELSHIRHMDIKLTLMASILANITLMVLDMFFYAAIYSGRKKSNDRTNWLFLVIYLIRYLLPVINILLLLYLSRTREYMADAGSVELLRDNQPLASALLKIQNDHENNHDVYSEEYAKTPHENVRREAYIYDPVQAGIEPMDSLADFFSTHPSLKNRLANIGIKVK